MARWAHWARAALLLLAAGARALSPPLCPRDAPARCRLLGSGSGTGEYTFSVDDTHLEIEFSDSGYFKLTCEPNVTLDNPALPRFATQLRVNKVHFVSCPPPQHSYAAALLRLCVHVLDKLKLVGAGDVTSAHLAGLPNLRALEAENLTLGPGALQALPELRRLLLDRVRLPPRELLHLPPRLQVLQLKSVHHDVPADALLRLPELANLTVRDHERVRVQPAGTLRRLSLETAVVSRSLSPKLHILSLYNWAEPRPEPWRQCGALDSLEMHFVATEELPTGWLQECAALHVLRIHYARRLRTLRPGALAGAALQQLDIQHCALRALPAGLLAGAAQLKRLSVTSCALRELPAGLLDDARLLAWLNLSDNALLVLPGGLFGVTKILQELDLSKNNLTTDVFSSLEAVTSLTSLKLSDNIHLKDSCVKVTNTITDTSQLQFLINLTNLELRHTNTSIICRDWRHSMPRLQNLDLADNNITLITYEDLQFGNNATVRLLGNNVTTLDYTPENYKQALQASDSSARALVLLDGALACDCRVYWAARALRDAPRHVRLRGATCSRAGPLGAVPPHLLLCAAPGLCAAAPRGCRCALQPHAPQLHAPAATRLLLRCERANLSRAADALAPVRRAARAAWGERAARLAWDLRLADNHITELSADELPPHVVALDLRGNELSSIDADVAASLVSGDGTLWLARNPLACHCGAARALHVLRQHRAAVADYADTACAGREPAPCRSPAALALLAGAAALALLASAALAGLLAHPAARLRLKAALHARGLLPGEREEADGRRFDAFISFSHGDERFVRDELVARLESGPAPYRLCLHYRDWAPGGWIPAQIAASVRASRRTVAVVSEHWLRSAWARAEFREAHALALRDARPRLLVVLLAAPERLPLDARLRRYLAGNTYVRWGDPWFWDKLRLALPRARAPPPAAEPATIPSSPPTAQYSLTTSHPSLVSPTTTATSSPTILSSPSTTVTSLASPPKTTSSLLTTTTFPPTTSTSPPTPTSA